MFDGSTLEGQIRLTSLGLALAALPASLWLWYFYRQDRRPEPWGLIALAFLGGALVVWPVFHAQRLLSPFFPEIVPEQDFARLLLSTTALAGLLEELAKLAVVVILVAWRHDFDEPVDGLIYAFAAAMGFTMGEDLVQHLMATDAALLLRPPGHAMFSALWGYPLGMMVRGWRWPTVVVGLLTAVVIHGLWDTIAFVSLRPESELLIRPILMVLGVTLFWFLEYRLREAQ